MSYGLEILNSNPLSYSDTLQRFTNFAAYNSLWQIQDITLEVFPQEKKTYTTQLKMWIKDFFHRHFVKSFQII